MVECCEIKKQVKDLKLNLVFQLKTKGCGLDSQRTRIHTDHMESLKALQVAFGLTESTKNKVIVVLCSTETKLGQEQQVKRPLEVLAVVQPFHL